MNHDMFTDISPDVLEDAIEKWVRGKNCKRNREILKDRLLNGYTFERLAEIHDMSVRNVKSIVYREEMSILPRLRK